MSRSDLWAGLDTDAIINVLNEFAVCSQDIAQSSELRRAPKGIGSAPTHLLKDGRA
jgi:hypothetical protein